MNFHSFDTFTNLADVLLISWLSRSTSASVFKRLSIAFTMFGAVWRRSIYGRVNETYFHAVCQADTLKVMLEVFFSSSWAFSLLTSFNCIMSATISSKMYVAKVTSPSVNS